MTDQTGAPEAKGPAVSLLSLDKPGRRFAIYKEPGTSHALLVLAPDGQEIKCELSGDDTHISSLRACLEELKGSAAAVKDEDRLETITNLIREKVEAQGFKMEPLPDGDVQIELGINLRTGMTIGKHKALHPFTQPKDDIGRNIQKLIQTAFDRPAEELAAATQEAADQGNHKEAARLVIVREADLILFARSRALLDAICAIDRQKLEPSEAHKIRQIIVSVASAQHRDEIASDAAEELLQHDLTLNEQARYGLRNMIAAAALKRGERESGLAMLRELLEEADKIDAGQRGWIWRNLSMALEPDDPEARQTARHSIDAFLEAGDKEDAARSISHLSRLQEHDEPTSAIRQFDQMLDIMSNEGVLDDEIRANILHGKARKLLEFGNSRAALEAALLAIGMRRGALGAEEGLISSLHLAAIAAGNHGDQASADAMEAEAKTLESEIGSEHFEVARRATTLFKQWDAGEAKSLLDIAQRTDDLDIYAGIHTAIAIHDPSISLAQRLGKLESTLRELERRRARSGTKHPVRLAIAQILKDQGEFKRAAGWYRKILDDAPLDATTGQLFVDALWKAKEWGDAAIYLERQLNSYGDQGVLLYAYGRSLFEAGRLSDSVGVFTRALRCTENPGLQQAIRKYRDDALELGGSIPSSPAAIAPDTPVTLDELRDALKEFATFVSASKRGDFWEKPEDAKQRAGNKKHVWTRRPEKHGQTLLHTYLKATFKERVDIFEEIGVGAGRLDLLVRFAGGVSAIIELKMCGNGYSTEYARSGEDQIEHYMANRKVHMGFLVTFDARQRDNGSRLISKSIGPGNTIEETTIDVRPTVKGDDSSD